MFRDYLTALEKKKGKEEAQRILEVRRWNSNIYPNVSLMSQFQQLRVVHPIAVNRTVVHTYNFRLKGAPEQMFRNTISFANIVNGTGSLVLTDDLEIYNRIDMGLSSQGAEWLQIGRGYQSDLPDAHGGRKGINSTSEVYIRNMLDAWQGYMSNGAAHERRARGVLTPMAKKQKSRPRIAAPSRRRATPPRAAGRRERKRRSTCIAACCFSNTRRGCSTRRSSTTGWRCSPPTPGTGCRASPNQPNPHDTVSLIYDDRRLLETRVRRLASPRMYSQEPRSRTSRIVANVTIEDAEGRAATVRSKFLMIEYRREQQRLFAGTAWHRLVQLDGAIRIAWKRVDLVNCDAPLDGITQPF